MLNRSTFNVWSIILLTAIGFGSTYIFDTSKMGMAILIIPWIPVVAGAITLLVYGLSSFFMKKYRWIFTLILFLFMANWIYRGLSM